MNTQLSVSEIFENAANLGKQDFDQFFRKLTILNAHRSNVPLIKSAESDLLLKINAGFPTSKWERLQYLDWKMESTGLNEKEAAESLKLAVAYENHSVDRLQLLIKLANLRGVSLDEVMAQLGLKTQENG
jgi:hypothetical protein